MKIDFTVGEIERHQMELSFDQVSGDLYLLMDGTQVLQDSPTIAVEPISYELSVGAEERHKLAFQLAFGEMPCEFCDGSIDDGIQATPRLSLMVSAISD